MTLLSKSRTATAIALEFVRRCCSQYHRWPSLSHICKRNRHQFHSTKAQISVPVNVLTIQILLEDKQKIDESRGIFLLRSWRSPKFFLNVSIHLLFNHDSNTGFSVRHFGLLCCRRSPVVRVPAKKNRQLAAPTPRSPPSPT